jgi:hypothetical protein
MKKLYLFSMNVPHDVYLGPAPWTIFPEGIEIAEHPKIHWHDHGVRIDITVRCEPEIGKAMIWTPFEKPTETEGGK